MGLLMMTLYEASSSSLGLSHVKQVEVATPISPTPKNICIYVS